MSLLTTACEKLYREWSHPTIRFLIERNPSALLWKRADWRSLDYAPPIYTIAQHPSHNVLMPWIAEIFPWVLDHRACQQRTPGLQLVSGYTGGMCSASIVRQFLEVYPKGLCQEDRLR
jgi:hypothetical protein